MKALYIGSFDPFTNGHYDIYLQATQIFDEVKIGIAINPQKTRRFTMCSCMKAIDSIMQEKYKILLTRRLTTDVMDEYGYDYLIRGLRNTSDYLYEEQLFQMYKELKPDFKVIYLRAENNVSSTFVNELMKRGKDVSKYLPYDSSILEREE